LQYVCSAFVSSIWKAAGLYGDLEINSTEVSPHDIYMLSFLETDETKRPQQCRDADPGLDYCQVHGKWRININGQYGFLEPYDHMFEQCTTITPDYAHSPTGC
jgi:hypothetical protein